MTRACSPATPIAVLLANVRDVRFGQGIHCPRCGDDRVQRWGSFSERQRYRCSGCRRTFSDLTGTPASYSKRALLWPSYAQCMREGLTVRRAAARVGIHRCTAFRWRHAILDQLRQQDAESISGWVELGWTWFPYSEKGRRNPVLHDPTLSTNVLLACDRAGNVVTGMAEVAPPRRILSREIERILEGRIEGPMTVLADHGVLGPAAAFARRSGGRFLDARCSVRPARGVPAALNHTRTARAYGGRLHGWMSRFHGVATRYLPNYLIWHRVVDHAYRHSVDRMLLRWLSRESSSRSPTTAGGTDGSRRTGPNSSGEHDAMFARGSRVRRGIWRVPP